MIKAFPKIFAIGTDYIRDIFDSPVELSEKVDGSQIAFGLDGDGQLFVRSKGAQLHDGAVTKMFQEGFNHIKFLANDGRLPSGVSFYGEYLQRPKHNTLKYDRIPKNHIILFGSSNLYGDVFSTDFETYAEQFDLEVVPKETQVIFSADDLRSWLDRESVLGGAKVEGVVVKNYAKKFLLGGQPMPMMCGKFVSEAFKETHRNRWGKEETGKGKLETFFESFRSEARWRKSVQHLAETGVLSNSPRDIGVLLREIHKDIRDEERDAIKDFLWELYIGNITRTASAGFPEWYKNQLLNRSFDGGGVSLP